MHVLDDNILSSFKYSASVETLHHVVSHEVLNSSTNIFDVPFSRP